ncbi:MAG: hypothetical protein ACRELE_05400 [Gemmatimonadales bacterium]
MTTSRQTVVVTDASVVINLLHVGRLPMLLHLPGLRFVVPDDVVMEVTDIEQRAALGSAISGGMIERCQLNAQDGAPLILELSGRLGLGEIACLALAELHGWTIACDERRFFRAETIRRVGTTRLIGTPELFLQAIEAQAITIEEADADKATLEQKSFKMRFGSFSELLETRRER